MKIELFAICVCAVLVTFVQADGGPNYIKLREEVCILRAELARQGAYAFVTNRSTTPAVAPHIHSQCWVDWLPAEDAERIAYEQEKRDFGLDFIGELEKLALEDPPLDDVEALEDHAERALAIAEWFKTACGYGNQFLKKWCEGIALSSMGGMAVNIQCDTNRVLNLMARVDDWQNNVFRQVAILNEEAPHRFKMPKFEKYEEAGAFLEKQWNPRQWAAIRYYQGKRINGESILVYSQVKDGPREYAFYFPERVVNQDNPVKDSWQLKKHLAVCIYGVDRKMTRVIHELLRWRGLAGGFPVPTEAEIQDINLGYAYRRRLDDIWNKYTKRKEMSFPAQWAVLEIYARRFADWDTRALQMRRERYQRSQ